jgi:hypothetical protein
LLDCWVEILLEIEFLEKRNNTLVNNLFTLCFDLFTIVHFKYNSNEGYKHECRKSCSKIFSNRFDDYRSIFLINYPLLNSNNKNLKKKRNKFFPNIFSKFSIIFFYNSIDRFHMLFNSMSWCNKNKNLKYLYSLICI